MRALDRLGELLLIEAGLVVERDAGSLLDDVESCLAQIVRDENSFHESLSRTRASALVTRSCMRLR